MSFSTFPRWVPFSDQLCSPPLFRKGPGPLESMPSPIDPAAEGGFSWLQSGRRLGFWLLPFCRYLLDGHCVGSANEKRPGAAPSAGGGGRWAAPPLIDGLPWLSFSRGDLGKCGFLARQSVAGIVCVPTCGEQRRASSSSTPGQPRETRAVAAGAPASASCCSPAWLRGSANRPGRPVSAFSTYPIFASPFGRL